MLLTDNQTKALAALRSADDSVRIQGQAFGGGKMCACTVVVNALMPEINLDTDANSFDSSSDVHAVYSNIERLIGNSWRKLAGFNDEKKQDDNTPLYNFAEVADKMEEFWK